MSAVVLAFWAVVVAWTAAVAIICFFVVGVHFPDRGATPLAGARVSFFSDEHRRQLREYREQCVARGKTLFWWRFVRSFVVAFPFLMAIGVALSLWATR
jgi:amino acid transporter